MTAQLDAGRSNQKKRTRTAIVEAARELIATGAEVTMPAIARTALVSEATAYRYFPDLPSLISEALAGSWPPPAEALRPVADSPDPVVRVSYACEFLLRGILARQGAVRAMIAATVTRPETAKTRPGIRFGLIDHALEPLRDTLGATNPDALTQLERDLAVVVSAEALFSLTDLCGLTPDEAVASAVHTARTLTEAAVRATGGERAK
ncbi:TetR/AcrR family transcriptional regulator [Streptomyces roseochromogenus]|uniref:TetR family transcriptional regulator n=1 Tax=Streptomyces roseochromogenus subsp. oscitans DS 12.976 TaxID=1352936 RepID=V6KXY1_STRRC|nr:TetR/AcrR family transcriptional regulator [Streptomyces roseochromogenus]EST36281.1 TetR family transcriptional regulator [Streptomyces roseochromogenus subsp. oscitans DS 12.976]